MTLNSKRVHKLDYRRNVIGLLQTLNTHIHEGRLLNATKRKSTLWKRSKCHIQRQYFMFWISLNRDFEIELRKKPSTCEWVCTLYVCAHRLRHLWLKRSNTISKTKKFSLLFISMKRTTIRCMLTGSQHIYSITGKQLSITNCCVLSFLFLSILQLRFPYFFIYMLRIWVNINLERR